MRPSISSGSAATCLAIAAVIGLVIGMAHEASAVGPQLGVPGVPPPGAGGGGFGAPGQMQQAMGRRTAPGFNRQAGTLFQGQGMSSTPRRTAAPVFSSQQFSGSAKAGPMNGVNNVTTGAGAASQAKQVQRWW